MKNKKASRNQTLLPKPQYMDEHLASPLVRYSGPFLKWIREELREMNQRIRLLKFIHKALHMRDDTDRQNVS